MENAKILIIEDDQLLRRAMLDAFERKGVNALATAGVEEANQVLLSQPIEYLFVDCLLPGISGDEFIVRLRKEHPEKKYKIILMSGIYTDKSTIQDLLKKTQATAFLKKPFDLEQMLTLVKSSTQNSENSLKSLYHLFSKENLSTREKRKIIDSVDEISGYDLPFIYNLLAETKSSGFLNIYFNNTNISGITFANGCILGVDIEDKTTYIGEMLIQSGFVSTDDIQKALQSKNNQRLGQRLISSNLMSPHALDLTMMEQMNVRLAKTITERKVKINFASSEVETSQPSIDSEQLLNYMHDWIASKIPISWLKNLYATWMGHLIIPTASFKLDHLAMRMSLIKSLNGLPEKLANKATLNNLLKNPEYNQMALYKALHFLHTKGLISFSKEMYFVNENENLEFVNNVLSQLKQLSEFEILQSYGLARLSTHELAISEITNIIGPKPSSENQKLIRVWEESKNIIVKAIMNVSSETIGKLEKKAEIDEAANKLKATQLVDEARKELMLNLYQPALEKLKEASKLNTNIFQVNIYLAWAKLGISIPKKNKDILKEVEMDLMQVSPDERYDALYPYVMGLYFKAKNDLLNSKKSFDKALAMDTTFIAARRELNLVEMLIKKNKKNDSIFTMDLKDVVTVLFKKR